MPPMYHDNLANFHSDVGDRLPEEDGIAVAAKKQNGLKMNSHSHLTEQKIPAQV